MPLTKLKKKSYVQAPNFSSPSQTGTCPKQTLPQTGGVRIFKMKSCPAILKSTDKKVHTELNPCRWLLLYWNFLWIKIAFCVKDRPKSLPKVSRFEKIPIKRSSVKYERQTSEILTFYKLNFKGFLTQILAIVHWSFYFLFEHWGSKIFCCVDLWGFVSFNLSHFWHSKAL